MLTELLADEPETPRSLADIARHLGVAKATCYPMVVALTEAGWLIRHPTRKTYRLGPALIPIGRAATTATDVVDLARSVMHELADASDMASIAFVQSGSDVVVAEVVQPVGGRRGTLGLRLGDKVLLAPPIGSGIAAWYPPEQREEWYALGGQNLGVEVDVLRADVRAGPRARPGARIRDGMHGSATAFACGCRVGTPRSRCGRASLDRRAAGGAHTVVGGCRGR